MKTVNLFSCSLVHPAVNMLLGTWGQPNSLNFDLPHYLEELLSLLWKRGCPQAGERIFLLRKSPWAAPSGNTGLHNPIKMEFCSSVIQESWEHSLCVCYRHMGTWHYTYLRACMHMYRYRSIKYREAYMYTTYLAGKGSKMASCPTAASRSSAGLNRHIFTNLPQEY